MRSSSPAASSPTPSASTGPARCSSARRASRRSRSVPPPTAARTRRRSRRSGASSCASTTTQLARAQRARGAVRGGLRARPRHRVGVRRRAALPAAVPGGHPHRQLARGRRTPPVDSETVEVIEQVPLFDGLTHRDVEGIAAMFKERRFDAGETVTREGAGGAAFFVIESGEATVTSVGRELGPPRRRRLLRRGRADRRRRAHGDDHRDDRPRLPRPHLLGVPAARAAERRRSPGTCCRPSPAGSAPRRTARTRPEVRRRSRGSPSLRT